MFIVKKLLMKIKVTTLIFSCFATFNIYSKSLSFFKKEKLFDAHFLSLGSIYRAETFANSNVSANYTNGSFIGNDGVVWNCDNVRNESLYPITAESLILRNATSKITSSKIFRRSEDFTCSLLKGFTGAGDRQVELFINRVSKGTFVAWDNNDVQIFTVLNINIIGDVEFSIKNSGTEHLEINPLSVTKNYTLEPPITPSDIEIFIETVSAEATNIEASYVADFKRGINVVNINNNNAYTKTVLK